MSPRLRSLLVLLAGGAALAFAADALARAPNLLVPRDFLEYWAAGRVNLRGGNPYHPAELLAQQKLADPAREHAVMMWNPPPALAVYMPLGGLPPGWATLVWVGLQLAAVFVACDWLWRAYSQDGPLAPRAGCERGEQQGSADISRPGRAERSSALRGDRSHGPREAPLTGPRPTERADHLSASRRWVAAVVGFAFVGTWWLVAYGQNTGLLALGLAGFLHFRRKDRPLTAGAFAALTALKPHLLACFGVLLVADAVTRRGAKSLASGAAAVAVALGVVLAANPHAVAQFLEATRHPAEGAIPLSDWALPVPAYWLRTWLAPDRFWVQFVPCALACAGFLAYRFWRGKAWDWARELPLVVAVSLITTPYGGWIFDLTVLLVPVVWAAARLAFAGRWKLLAAFVAGQGAVTAASLEWAGGLHAYWWVAPAALGLCLLALLPPRPEPPGAADRSIH